MHALHFLTCCFYNLLLAYSESSGIFSLSFEIDTGNGNILLLLEPWYILSFFLWLALPTKSRILCLDLIIEYSSLRYFLACVGT